MTHSLLTPALVADLENLSKTIGQLATDLRDANTQDTVASATEEAPKDAAKKTRMKPLFDPTPKAPVEENTDSQVSEEKASITLEQLRAVLAEKSQAGLTSQVKELLTKYGAAKLSAVKPEDYAAVYEAAKALG